MIDRFTGTFRFLSNFWPAPVIFDGIEYPTVEHAYQAAKTERIDQRVRIEHAQTPGQAKRLGRKVDLRPDWEEIKEAVMLTLLRQKFLKGTRLAQWLDETADHELVEGNTWGDVYWGVCDGVGQNKLGKMLMQIREENRQ